MIDIVNNPAQLPFFETVLLIILSVAAVMVALFAAVAFQDTKQRRNEDYWNERGFGYYNPKIGMSPYNVRQVGYTNGIGVLQLVCIAILVIFLIMLFGW